MNHSICRHGSHPIPVQIPLTKSHHPFSGRYRSAHKHSPVQSDGSGTASAGEPSFFSGRALQFIIPQSPRKCNTKHNRHSDRIFVVSIQIQSEKSVRDTKRLPTYAGSLLPFPVSPDTAERHSYVLSAVHRSVS